MTPSSLPQAAAEGESREQSMPCTQCGILLTEENFVAAQTRLRVASGQEVITIFGGLELKTPPWGQ
jgi:hypothetical protein